MGDFKNCFIGIILQTFANFFIRSETVNILGFANQTFYVAAI